MKVGLSISVKNISSPLLAASRAFPLPSFQELFAFSVVWISSDRPCCKFRKEAVTIVAYRSIYVCAQRHFGQRLRCLNVSGIRTLSLMTREGHDVSGSNRQGAITETFIIRLESYPS